MFRLRTNARADARVSVAIVQVTVPAPGTLGVLTTVWRPAGTDKSCNPHCTHLNNISRRNSASLAAQKMSLWRYFPLSEVAPCFSSLYNTPAAPIPAPAVAGCRGDGHNVAGD